MTKILFWLLLLANGVMLVLMADGGHESTYLKRQFHPERISLITAQSAEKSVAEPVLACFDVGSFSRQAANVFKTRLAPLKIPAIAEKPEVAADAKAESHMVYLPPKNGAAGASQRVTQLHNLGFADTYVLQEPPSRRWSISLGLFKNKASAQALLDQVRRAGVSEARIESVSTAVARISVELRGLDASMQKDAAAIVADFPGVEMRACQ